MVGCASSTGRGEFPEFSVDDYRQDQSLVILPPIGLESSEVSSSIFTHLQKDQLERTFKSVEIASNRTAGQYLKDNFTGSRVETEEARKLREEIHADLLLAFYVHQLKIEQYTETETRTVYQTNSSISTTNIFNDASNADNGRRVGPGAGPGRRVGPTSSTSEDTSYNTVITQRTSHTTRRQVPVKTGNVRVVLSMSAMIYDVQHAEVIWKGKRIERADRELENLSTVELQDIVIERIMYRIINTLTA